MRVNLTSFLRGALICLVALHLIFKEDTYGLDIEPAIWYRPIAGLTIVDAAILILTLIASFGKAAIKYGLASRLLLGLLVVTLVTAYANAWIRGNLFGTGQGTGLKEARAATMMLCLYYVFRRTFATLPDLLRFQMHFRRLILASAGICLAQFVLDISPLATAAHERMTAFEGPMLTWWVFGFAVFAGRALEKPFGFLAWLWPAIMALAVLFSFRRSPAYMTAIVFAVQCAYCMWNPRRAMYVIAVLAVVCAAVVMARDSWWVAKLNPATLFDTESEEYAGNLASNVQHVDDIKVGWSLVRQNLILGVGPGAKLESHDPLVELTVDTAIHMQYFHFWLRCGMLGLLLLLAYYSITLGYANAAIRGVIEPRIRELAVGIGGFVVASASVASLTGLNIYGTNKMQFLTIYIFAAAESLYLYRTQIVSTRVARV